MCVIISACVVKPGESLPCRACLGTKQHFFPFTPLCLLALFGATMHSTCHRAVLVGWAAGLNIGKASPCELNKRKEFLIIFFFCYVHFVYQTEHMPRFLAFAANFSMGACTITAGGLLWTVAVNVFHHVQSWTNETRTENYEPEHTKQVFSVHLSQ